MVFGVRLVILLIQEFVNEDGDMSAILKSAIVGFFTVLHAIPLAVIGVPLVVVAVPPPSAVLEVMFVTALVVTVGIVAVGVTVTFTKLQLSFSFDSAITLPPDAEVLSAHT